MSNQRWGTFSVKDHLMPNAFIADVMLYDKLSIPYPPDEEEKTRWVNAGWNPDELHKKMEILDKKGLLVEIPWNQTIREAYASRYIMAEDIKEGVKTKFADPYFASRATIAEGFLPKNPPGVLHVWPMIAYPSMYSYTNGQQEKTIEEKGQELCIVLSNHFFVPEDPSKHPDDLLRDAVELASRDDFRRKREDFYNWQQEILKYGIPPEEAAKDMELRLSAYEEVVKKSQLKLVLKYMFLAVEVGLGLAGAKLGAPIETAVALTAVTKFTLFDRKIDVESGEYKGASMIHDFNKKFMSS